MIYYTISGPNTIVKHSDSPAVNTQFDLNGGTWTQTVLPAGTPTTVSDLGVLTDLNLRLGQLRPLLPLVQGFLFYGGSYHGPTAVPQF